jgi:acyl-CoA synthetase (AMP-forming)/AMP-acid ligase II
VARQDADGALFIVGRTKELIVRAGFNVYPLEVETLLNAHPRVLQSAVVGRPAPDGEEEVIAFVEARKDGSSNGTGAGAGAGGEDGSALPHALSLYLAAQLAPYKLPAHIVVLAALPAGATGKVLKGVLRELALASRAPAS